MIKIEKTFKLDISVNQAWQLFNDAGNYPRYVKFLKKVTFTSPIEVGSHWQDTTTILFLPLKFNHEMLVIRPKEEFSFKVLIPQGKLIQSYFLKPNGAGTNVLVTISFGFSNLIIEKLIGPVLKSRLETMLTETAKNLERV